MHSILVVLAETFMRYRSNGLSELPPNKLMPSLPPQYGFMTMRTKDVQGLVGAEDCGGDQQVSMLNFGVFVQRLSVSF